MYYYKLTLKNGIEYLIKDKENLLANENMGCFHILAFTSNVAKYLCFMRIYAFISLGCIFHFCWVIWQLSVYRF